MFHSLIILVLVFLTLNDAAAQTRLKVTTILDKPFVVREEDGSFQGFIVDILDDIAQRLDFKYDMAVVADGRYGLRDDNGNWSGMVGELIRKEVDLAAAPLTTTAIRGQVIDFSRPFLNTGLSILMSRDAVFGKDNSLYNISYFLNPFSTGVWLMILVCFLVVSILIALLNRFDPYEYGARKEEQNLPPGTNGTLSFRESLLFCFSTLTLQGYQRPPMSLAVRVLAVFWWFFCVVVVASYIANLVQITQEANTVRNPQFTNLDDIVESDINMGIIFGGSTYSFFHGTKEPKMHKAWLKMNADKENFSNSTAHALSKVVQGNFAHIAEYPYLEYVVARNCSLVMVGRLLTSVGYAFGFPKGSEMRSKFDDALYEMSREGKLEQYHEKWWHSDGTCVWSKVTSDMLDPRLASGRGPVVPLTLTQFVGPILVLVIGFFLTIIVFVLELLYYFRASNRNRTQQPTSQAKA